MMLLLNAVIIGVCLLVCFAIGYVVFFGVWMASVWATRRRRKWLWAIASAPIYTVLFVVLLGGAFWFTTRPAAVFERSFGFAPPADVANLHSSTWVLADSGHTYLAFTASRGTITRIAGRGLTLATSPSAPDALPGNAPPWWTRPSGSDVEVYHGDFTGRAFLTSETEVLYYDVPSGQAYFLWSGID